MRFGYWMPVFGGWLRNVRDEVVQRLLREDTVTHHGPLYRLEAAVLEPKPTRLPPVYMGGESARAKEVIAGGADAYVMEQITGRLRAYEQAGVDLTLLQFSPQREEMARFGRDVISRYPGRGTS